MYTLWNLAVLYIIEPNALAYIAFERSGDVIVDVTDDIIGIEQWRVFPLNITKTQDNSWINPE